MTVILAGDIKMIKYADFLLAHWVVSMLHRKILNKKPEEFVYNS